MTDSTNNRIVQQHDEAGHVSTSTSSDIFRVGVKIPPFWPQEPAIWFAQVEGQFAISNITSDATKFYYVVAQLEHQYAAEVKDIIISPPADNKYEKLKNELIKRLSASREKEVKQLLVHEELGDRKPSQFMRHLQHLAGPNVPEDFLKTIWTSRLPRNIQTVIASQPHSSLEVLADLADRINEIVPAQQIASASMSSSRSCSYATLEQLTKQVTELTKQVQALSTQVFRSQYNKSGTHSRSRSRSSSRSREGPLHRSHSSYVRFSNCWFHRKFGSKANKCIKPCDYDSENARGNQ